MHIAPPPPGGLVVGASTPHSGVPKLGTSLFFCLCAFLLLGLSRERVVQLRARIRIPQFLLNMARAHAMYQATLPALAAPRSRVRYELKHFYLYEFLRKKSVSPFFSAS